MNTVSFLGEALTPSKVVCVGRNYAAHAKEMGSEIPSEVVFFCKPNSAIASTLVSYREEAIHFEGELSFLVIGGRFAGVAFGLDLTKRATQRRLKEDKLPWERAKAFDGSALFSSFVALPEDISGLRFELTINDVLRQRGGISDMIFPPLTVLDDCQRFMTLNDGDVVMSGTPEGVGAISVGDVFLSKVYDKEKLLVSASWIAS